MGDSAKMHHQGLRLVKAHGLDLEDSTPGPLPPPQPPPSGAWVWRMGHWLYYRLYHRLQGTELVLLRPPRPYERLGAPAKMHHQGLPLVKPHGLDLEDSTPGPLPPPQPPPSGAWVWRMGHWLYYRLP